MVAFHYFTGWFLASVPYLLAVGSILLGLFEIIKDREDYEKARLNKPVAIIFVVVGVLQIISLLRDASDRKEAGKNISDLKGQVTAANKAQTDNTALYIESFGKMSTKLTALETEIRTDALKQQNQELQKKIGGLQTELQSTEKILNGPKASLTFTFAPYQNGPTGITPITDITLSKQPDGTLHFEFSILNNTDVDATQITINLVICDLCRFAKESPELSKVRGLSENRRFAEIPILHAKELFRVLGVDVIVPSSLGGIEVGFEYRCHSCSLDNKYSKGTIHFQ
jgi:hypothetical protein